ncbi:GFA family protein [Xanthobacter sp. KR7-65]|uniref:GFA family protein n=1 Tax=Xanthobacter sp. KR7-65 TaxID=3156612 RepID=UPI0032B5BBA1
MHSDRMDERLAMEWSASMLSGRCLCGACTYEIDGDPVVVAICHCLDCQRLSGAGHTTGAMFAEAGIRISGSPSTYSLTSAAGNTVTRFFCGACGSPLFGRNTGMPGYMTVMMGTLEQSDHLAPQVAIFTRTKRSWDAENDAVQAFETQPAWTPKDGV